MGCKVACSATHERQVSAHVRQSPSEAPSNKALQTDKGKLSCLLHSQSHASLSLPLSLVATDAQGKQLAEGQVSSFAAWLVEARAHDELLLSAGRTQ